MVDTTLAGFVIDVKVLEVVVKVDAARTEVTAEERSVGRKDGRDINVALAAEGNGKTRLPFVEVSNDGLVAAALGELWCELRMTFSKLTSPRNQATM